MLRPCLLCVSPHGAVGLPVVYDLGIFWSCNSYTMTCPPVRGDNPRALASGLSFVQLGGQTWYTYFIPPTSVLTLHILRYFVIKLVRVV